MIARGDGSSKRCRPWGAASTSTPVCPAQWSGSAMPTAEMAIRTHAPSRSARPTAGLRRLAARPPGSPSSDQGRARSTTGQSKSPRDVTRTRPLCLGDAGLWPAVLPRSSDEPRPHQGNGGKAVRIRAPPQSGMFPFATRLRLHRTEHAGRRCVAKPMRDRRL